MQDKLQDLRIK